ncbi:Bug family tripartite tricarboxylate transporter substrate binding protein [Roseomonas chloroacetimidivorans]|uniref:Bug family tripartite tricarboxylate transporter substrate binding protein n=1 Tax=Roseomonas chloroacetimidivorans TaxID=1766656 RepID=UPI003C7581B1
MIELNRRKLLQAASLLPCVLPGVGRAQNPWPAQPIRFIVPFAAGGPTDIAARLIADALSTRLPQRVIVENRSGAGAVVGTEAAAAAPKDGYTFLYTVVAHATLRAIFARLNFDPIKDFAPVALCGVIPAVLIVSPTLRVKSVQELVSLFKANPGKFNYGSSGVGASMHFTAELFLKTAGDLQVNHIPYRGSSAAMPDLLNGTLSMIMAVASDAVPHVQRGQLQALAVTGEHRLPQLPEVPTFRESGMPDFEAYTWHMLMAPAGTPEAIVNKMNGEVNRVLADPVLQKRLSDLSMEIRPDNTPASAAQWLQQETTKWERTLRDAGVVAN